MLRSPLCLQYHRLVRENAQSSHGSCWLNASSIPPAHASSMPPTLERWMTSSFFVDSTLYYCIFWMLLLKLKSSLNACHRLHHAVTRHGSRWQGCSKPPPVPTVRGAVKPGVETPYPCCLPTSFHARLAGQGPGALGWNGLETHAVYGPMYKMCTLYKLTGLILPIK